MKTQTITRYITSDGANFDHPNTARRHEIAHHLRDNLEEGAKLTSAGIIDELAARPEVYIKLLDDIMSAFPLGGEEVPEVAFKSVRGEDDAA